MFSKKRQFYTNQRSRESFWLLIFRYVRKIISMHVFLSAWQSGYDNFMITPKGKVVKMFVLVSKCLYWLDFGLSSFRTWG